MIVRWLSAFFTNLLQRRSVDQRPYSYPGCEDHYCVPIREAGLPRRDSRVCASPGFRLMEVSAFSIRQVSGVLETPAVAQVRNPTVGIGGYLWRCTALGHEHLDLGLTLWARETLLPTH